MTYPATQIVHWPGNSVPACELHAEKLKGLASFMGFSVSITPAAEGAECINCANEAARRG